MSSTKKIDVAIALVHCKGRWLAARRHENVHLGGQWEFPGGKVNRNEAPVEAAIRELREECGVEADVERTLLPLTCEYEDRTVRLHPVVCAWRAGEAAPLHSQECRWLTLAELRALEMPAVNAELIREIELHAG